MQRPIAHRTWPANAAASSGKISDHRLQPSATVLVGSGAVNGGRVAAKVRKMVSENALVVFGRQGCCMCHVLKLLLQGLGVNPTVYEVEAGDESAVGKELASIASEHREAPPQFPAVFVGGRPFGGMERVMSTHISGELVPILKDAGALWL